MSKQIQKTFKMPNRYNDIKVLSNSSSLELTTKNILESMSVLLFSMHMYKQVGSY